MKANKSFIVMLMFVFFQKRKSNPEGWDRWWGRRKAHEGEDTYLRLILDVVRQKPTRLCKAIMLQLKITNKI